MPLREINLVIHFLGFGLFVTVLVSAFIIERQYRKSSDVKTKATLLGVMRSVGIISPFAMLVMLLTGIGNMRALGIGLFDFGWLTAKVIFFAIAAVNGILSGIRGRKRAALVFRMAGGEGTSDMETTIKEYDKQQWIFFIVNAILLLLIVSLSVFGRLGGQ